MRQLLETAGHRVASEEGDVLVTDNVEAAVGLAVERPVVVLVSAARVRQGIEAMRRGVYGYALLPLQPYEISLMVSRAAGSTADSAEFVPRPLAEIEREHIEATVRYCRNNRARAARLLGIGRNTLWRKLSAKDDTEVKSELKT